jgi:hypothetical protein
MPVCCAAAGGLAIAGHHKLQRCVFQAYGRVPVEPPPGRLRAFQPPCPMRPNPRAANRRPDPSRRKTIPSPARAPTSWPVRARPSSGNAGSPCGAPDGGESGSEVAPPGTPAAGGGRNGSLPCAWAAPPNAPARPTATRSSATRLIGPTLRPATLRDKRRSVSRLTRLFCYLRQFCISTPPRVSKKGRRGCDGVA